MRETGEPIVLFEDVHRVYRAGAGAGAAESRGLAGVSLSIERGTRVAIAGPSGCGKSTLLHLVGAMDYATAGRVVVDGEDVARLSDRASARFRATHIGFVFQLFNLIPTSSVMENVTLPARLAGVPVGEARARGRDLLVRVDLAERADDPPESLSGGQQQRVAVARALVNEPSIVLADEPTGALDEAAGERVLRLLTDVVTERGATLIVATHSDRVVAAADRIVRLVDGRVVEDRRRTAAEGAR